MNQPRKNLILLPFFTGIFCFLLSFCPLTFAQDAQAPLSSEATADAGSDHSLSQDASFQPTVEEGIAWFDTTKWQIEGKYWNDVDRFFARFPARAQPTLPKSVWNLSQHSAGMLVRFQTDSTEIRLRYKLLQDDLAMPHMPATGVSGFDLYTRWNDRWTWVNNTYPTQREAAPVLISGMLPGLREYMLYLPLYNGVESLEIGVPENTVFNVIPPRSEKPIVYYGSSITHGGCVSRPGMVYTAILGRRLDYPIINLGFSGSARMEQSIAELLGEMDAGLFVIDALPNMDPELVKERAVPFIQTLRKMRPNTPILLVEDRCFSNSYIIPSRATLHAANHQALKEAFDQLIQEGDQNLYYLPAENLLGEDLDYDGTVDSSHPNDLGMWRMTNVLEKTIRPILFESEE